MFELPKEEQAIEKKLTELYPKEWLLKTAIEVGFVKRDRKVDPVVFFWSLVLGFGVGLQRTLAELKRTYTSMAANKIAMSSFYERFKPELVAFLKQCVQKAVTDMANEPNVCMSATLKGFHDLLLVDSTLVHLHEKLATRWPGSRTNSSPAAIKLNLLMSAWGKGPRNVDVVEGKRSEQSLLDLGPWVKDRILLMDLGYFDHQRFQEINALGGFFVSRVKSNCNPLILRSLKKRKGIAIAGQRFKTVKDQFQKETVDLEVMLSTKKPENENRPLRVIGMWNENKKSYHFYVTNIPADCVTPEDIAKLYSA
ncbi:IS4 family transposase, partial [Heliobacillus mobilis]